VSDPLRCVSFGFLQNVLRNNFYVDSTRGTYFADRIKGENAFVNNLLTNWNTCRAASPAANARFCYLPITRALVQAGVGPMEPTLQTCRGVDVATYGCDLFEELVQDDFNQKNPWVMQFAAQANFVVKFRAKWLQCATASPATRAKLCLTEKLALINTLFNINVNVGRTCP
jgi:hypothetical protein